VATRFLLITTFQKRLTVSLIINPPTCKNLHYVWKFSISTASHRIIKITYRVTTAVKTNTNKKLCSSTETKRCSTLIIYKCYHA